VFGIVGAILGNQIGYWVGHKGGRPFVLKWGRYLKLTPGQGPTAMAISRG
jgi:membrane protein DedA with SNARE-associated domain